MRARLDAVLDPAGGMVHLSLVSLSDVVLEASAVAFTSVLQYTPTGATTALARRVAGYHLLPVRGAIEAGGQCDLGTFTPSHRPRHANDGPASAYLVHADGTAEEIAASPLRRDGDPLTPPGAAASIAARPAPWPALLPWPAAFTSTGNGAPVELRLERRTGTGRLAWEAVADLDRRLHGDAAVLTAEGPAGAGAVGVVVERRHDMAPEAYRVSRDGGVVTVTAAGDPGWRHGFVTLAQLARAGLPDGLHIDDAPQLAWRGLHVDLARQFIAPTAVERMIDLAAWRKLNRFHLHLTDDEAWRFPVAAYPELATTGGTRGHGLALPPMLGSGPDPYGRAYTREEIASWVGIADDLGVVLVPEIDVPAHCFAAMAAVPALRDVRDAARAVSVQGFENNSLYPGLATTMPFVEAVFGELAAHFPASPWLHLGGDEVPAAAWASSAPVQAYAACHGLAGRREIEAAFHRDAVAAIRRTTGRAIGAWQEAAEVGGVAPEDGYVVGWRDADSCRRLAEAGYDVVVSAGEAYYLDMAADDEWSSPGMSWAGTTSLADVCAFDPVAGWSPSARRHLLGVQACVWTEHIRDDATFDEMVFPRLDAIAERSWSGEVRGGAGDLAARAALLPRLTAPAAH